MLTQVTWFREVFSPYWVWFHIHLWDGGKYVLQKMSSQCQDCSSTTHKMFRNSVKSPRLAGRNIAGNRSRANGFIMVKQANHSRKL